MIPKNVFPQPDADGKVTAREIRVARRRASRAGAAWCFMAALLGLGAVPLSLAAQELQVDPNSRNVTRFISRTQVNEFEGVTNRIDGYVFRDGDPLSAPDGSRANELYFEVDLASLDTGIGLRNRHMRDDYLEVQKYPYASFKGRIIRSEGSGDGGAHITAAGTLTVHGVSREREIPCDVTRAGAGYTARCAFEVLLSDHAIRIPKIMFLKLSNQIRVEAEFTVIPGEDRPGEKP